LRHAEAYAYRGEQTLAFGWLARACTQRDPGLAFVKADPLFRNLHDDDRWQTFLGKMGLGD
jgi:hypothetical protein